MKKLAATGILFATLFGFLIYRSFSEHSSDVITVNGGVTSESQIIGNMIVQLLEHDTDYKVKFLNNLVSAQVNHVAMERGELGISSVRYTGTDLVTTLGRETVKDADQALEVVQNEFSERFNQEWYPSYGFANEFTFMVTKETAEKYQLSKVSDLQKHASNLTLGVDSGWFEREGDGYQAFTEAYNMSFKKVFPMQVGLLYDALNADNFDVIVGYSTDGRISSHELVMLEDDRQFFPPYTCSPVVDKELYEKYPQLSSVLRKLEGKISTETMQELNYQSDGELIEPEIVAQRFLEKHNYFEET
ncbi:osmoprotectant ABC transporter substrate-binding protein [Lactococcus muris]|uniref:osmoprotectant ABC transporter substrate-binding protein n=1 Tax=Lactococcus muris TaxID=2941330 RepID=UPI00203E3703|nr:osmoprotectant ABC transporter substrate-binding protein [Lactococcus muris]